MNVNFIVPIAITDAMLGGGTTLAEDPTAAWTSGTYSVGDERHVVATHRVYRCAVAGSSTTTPQNDPTRWVDMRPTNKWAPFDIYTSTAAAGTTSFTYVISPGYFNALALYGLTGSGYSLTVKDAPGGATIYSASGYLADDPLGWYEYLFTSPRTRNKLLFLNIPPRPAAEITLTITASSGQSVGLGMLVAGDAAPVPGNTDEWGGVLDGAYAEPVSNSYYKRNDDGTVVIKRRNAGTDMSLRVAMPRAGADAALALLQSVLDVPVAVIAGSQNSTDGFDGLNGFGLVTGRVVYETTDTAEVEFTVKGMI